MEDDVDSPPELHVLDDAECSSLDGDHEPLILVIYQGGRHGPLEALERGLYDHVVGMVEQHVPFGEKRPHLDVWIDSPGGDAHAAYKLATYLRAKFDTVHVVVPEYAKSAATLLSLVGSEIYMGPGAELGPLDVQDLREGEARMHSTLSTANAASTIFQNLVSQAVETGPLLLHVTGLARDRTIAHLLEFAASFSRPLIEKLDPEEMISAQTSLLLTINYATRLLDVSHREKLNAAATAQALVVDYPTHGHVIDRTTALNELGLSVRDLESYPLGKESVTLLRNLAGHPFVQFLDAPTMQQLSAVHEREQDGAEEADPEVSGSFDATVERKAPVPAAEPEASPRGNRRRPGPEGPPDSDTESSD